MNIQDVYEKQDIFFAYLLGTYTTFLEEGTHKIGKKHIHMVVRQGYKKEVAFELDSVGYSYMKMEMWIVEGISGKIKQKQKNPHLHPESS